MKSVAMIRTKHWKNAYCTMRTANGLGFDHVYLVDLVMEKPPKMNRRKIEMGRKPHDMFELITMEEFMGKVVPEYNVVSMELTEDAQDLAEFEWPDNPLIVVGPENGSVPDEVLQFGQQVKVQMAGVVNCFNVSCAASIAMWDQVRCSNRKVIK